MTTGISAPLVLLFVLTIFLLLNFRTPSEQPALLRKAMAPVCPMALIMLSVGVLLGVLDGAGMTDALAALLVQSVPAGLARYAPLLVMAVFTPLLAFFHYHSLYAAVPLFLALLPGADAARAVLPFLLLYPTCCSPMTALTQLACRITGEEPLRFTRCSLLPLCALSWASLLLGWAAGLFF